MPLRIAGGADLAASYRGAVIGCGRTASLFEEDPLRRKPASHMGHYRKSRRIRVVAGADIDCERREFFKRRWRVKHVYRDYREMLAAERPDIVSLTAYAPERHIMFKHCAEAGVKAIWIEKAIATSLRGARSMVRLADKHHITTVVNHPRRWSPKYIRTRELIDIGAIGVPEAIVSTFSGNLIHTGTHAFDMMRFLFGEVTAARGTPDGEFALPDDSTDKKAIEDFGASGSLRFANGASGTINARAKDYFIFEFEILGSAGAIRIGNSTPLTLLKPAPARYASDFEDLVPVDEAAAFPQGRRRRTGGAVPDLLAGLARGVESTNSIGQGFKALEIALGFHESFRVGGEWIALPLAKSSLKIDSR